MLNPLQKVMHGLRIICISKKMMAPDVAPAFWVIGHCNTIDLTFISKKSDSMINSIHYSNFSLKFYRLIHIFASHILDVKDYILNSRVIIKLFKPQKQALFVPFSSQKQQTESNYKEPYLPAIAGMRFLL